MSFILDALKKSEAERARQAGPTLVDLRVMAPRRGLPGWVIVLGLVLLANLVVLGVVLTRGGRDAGTAATSPTPMTSNAAVTSATVEPAPPPEPRPTNVLPPPSLPPAEVARPAVLPPIEYGGDTSGGRLITPAAGTVPPPTVAPPRAPAPRGNTAGLPSAEDLRLSGISLPALSMALHAWDPQPANRYVMINGQKLREGQQTSDGVEVEQITSDGAVMVWRQQRFVLTPGD